jgi:phage terminase small subunit
VPAHLDATERALWLDLHAAYDLSDPASSAMLLTAMEAHQRARRCRERVDADGEVWTDRFKQIKPHPLLAAERDARAAFVAGMRALNLDLGVS